MSVSIDIAKEKLAMWLEAENAVATGQSYEINGKKITRVDASKIRENIEFWEKKCLQKGNTNRRPMYN